jgi:serine/threonine protein kinase
MLTPTHPLTDRSAFLAAVQGSGLLTPTQFAKASESLPTEARTAAGAADFLVRAGFLTRFQADRLLAGRTDGFVIGQYTIQEEVGRGAMGRVYRANHRTMNRAVAIKVLDPDLTRTPAAREAFQREVRAAARLNHPNIVTAYDANEIGDRSYLVLEYADGPTLEALVAENGPLPVPTACEIVRQAALGLAHAHDAGMVHRDVKPSNILVARASRTGSAWVVKIADFGIARLAPPAADPGARPGPGRRGVLGTPDYVAPEQALYPDQADHRADLYSLGGVFYFLLAGRPPFPGGGVQEKIHRHVQDEPVRIDRLRPDVPRAVAEVVHKLLAKDPDTRFRSAGELADHLAAAADGWTADPFAVPDRPATPYVPGGHLAGSSEHAVAAGSDPSPWANLTADEAGANTLGPEHGITPLATPPATRRRVEPTLAVGVLALWVSVAVFCAVAVGLCIRVLGR